MSVCWSGQQTPIIMFIHHACPSVCLSAFSSIKLCICICVCVFCLEYWIFMKILLQFNNKFNNKQLPNKCLLCLLVVCSIFSNYLLIYFRHVIIFLNFYCLNCYCFCYMFGLFCDCAWFGIFLLFIKTIWSSRSKINSETWIQAIDWSTATFASHKLNFFWNESFGCLTSLSIEKCFL